MFYIFFCSRLSIRCAQDNDFREGVRALLIDKDQNPKWDPPTIEEVSDEKVKYYFSPLPEPFEENDVEKSYESYTPQNSNL